MLYFWPGKAGKMLQTRFFAIEKLSVAILDSLLAGYELTLYLKFKLFNQNIVFLPRDELIPPGVSL